MAGGQDLASLLRAIGTGDRAAATEQIEATPSLSVARLPRSHEFFIAECHAQVYEGDTALHAAAFAYDTEIARSLVGQGADVRARNRRGAEPLHAAVIGVPGSGNWDPKRQRAVISYLVGAGADPNAAALGGVTPLHRAVRNRCSAAVDALLARRRGSSPGERQRIDRHRARPVDDGAGWCRVGGSESRAADHRRAAETTVGPLRAPQAPSGSTMSILTISELPVAPQLWK